MTSPRFTTLNEWLAWMETVHPAAIDLSLGRITKVAKRLKILDLGCQVISVAGTNGKGSFVQSLSSLLMADGANVGCYTSPHILSYNERICIGGEPVSDALICSAFHELDKARGKETLTYFEFGTLAAMLIFKRAKLDYALLEVGLGGRLDAVNIVDADLSVITSIAIDHEAWLGSDRETIGREKAGILRAGSAFICADDNAPESVIHRAESLMCQSYFNGNDIGLEAGDDGQLSLNIRDKKGKPLRCNLPRYHLPAPSLLAALQAYQLLSGRLTMDAVAELLSEASLAGRFEHFHHQQKHFVFDVAHNPEAAGLLAARVANLDTGGAKPPLIFAAMQDKDVKHILDLLSPVFDHCVCTEVSDIPRSQPVGELYDLANAVMTNIGVQQSPSVNGALALVEQYCEERQYHGPVFIVGSFYLVAEAKALLLAE